MYDPFQGAKNLQWLEWRSLFGAARNVPGKCTLVSYRRRRSRGEGFAQESSGYRVAATKEPCLYRSDVAALYRKGEQLYL